MTLLCRNPKNDTGGGLDTKGCVRGEGEKARIYAASPILTHNTYVVVNTSHDIWLAAASQRAAGRRSSRHSASCPCRYAAMGSITLRMFLNYFDVVFVRHFSFKKQFRRIHLVFS